jgi:6-phosphogluconolactonase
MKIMSMKIVSVLVCLSLFARAQHHLFVGSYTPENKGGITLMRFSPQTGALEVVETTQARNPSFLAALANQKELFAVSEEEVGSLLRYQISPTGRLALVEERATGGSYSCHVTTYGSLVVTGQYGDGTLTVFKPDSTRRLKLLRYYGHEGSGPNAARQEGPHVHQVVFDPDGQSVYVPDLGIDRVMVWQLDPKTERLSLRDSLVCLPGSGPRHVVVNRRFVYVLEELTGFVSVFKKTKSGFVFHGRLCMSRPAYAQQAQSAEIAFSPNGRYLITSQRGADNTLAVARIRHNGQLRLRAHVPCAVQTPRHFAFDPSGKWLLVAGQDSNSIEVRRFKRGQIRAVSKLVTVPHPVCLLFVKKVEG